MIRIGVDAWNLPHDRRGIGRYVRAVLASWQRDFPVRVRVTLLVPESPPWFAAARYRRELPFDAAVRSRRFHAGARLDALWFPFNGPSWESFALPAIATLHDASPFDLPGYDDGARETFRAAVRRCTAIVTDSEFSKARLAAALSIDASRIEAIALGVDPPRPNSTAAATMIPPEPFVLFVGETEPRKDLATLVRALEMLAPQRRLGAAVVGRVVGQRPASELVTIRYLGTVDDDTLAALYRGCTAFAYPSRYEGFGLPILEAMSYGAPVVAAGTGALPEAGGDAALYFPAGDAGVLAARIAAVADDGALAADLGRRGLARAAAMPWRLTAERTLAAFERVLGV